MGKEASSIQESFEKAEVLYQKKDYQGAIQIYEGILRQGIATASLYYNLGSAYFKAGDLGRAVLNYERALKRTPKDKELNHNLSFVRDLLQDKVEAPESPRWIQMLLGFHRLFPLNGVVGLASLCYSFIFFLASYAMIRPSFRPMFFRVLLPPLVGFFVLFSGIALMKVLEPSFSPAIVIAEELDVYYAPSTHETKAFVLHAGTKCAVRNVQGEWMLIWLPNDRGGWVHQSGVERI